MNDQQIGKLELEREHLQLFLDAYRCATGETLGDMCGGETPDFLGYDERGRSIGIELTSLRFSPGERHLRRILTPGADDIDAWYELCRLVEKKQRVLLKGRWPACERKILVIAMVDASIVGIAVGTDKPKKGDFDEVWLADHTQIDAFGTVDLFAALHPRLSGYFATGDQGQKPYG